MQKECESRSEYETEGEQTVDLYKILSLISSSLVLNNTRILAAVLHAGRSDLQNATCPQQSDIPGTIRLIQRLSILGPGNPRFRNAVRRITFHADSLINRDTHFRVRATACQSNRHCTVHRHHYHHHRQVNSTLTLIIHPHLQFLSLLFSFQPY